MKILHVIAQLPTRTGSGVYYSNVVEELKKYNHQQAALFACQDDFEFEAITNQYPVYFKTEALPFPIAGMSDVMPYDNTVYSQMDDSMIEKWSAAFKEQLIKAKAEFEPDIVILHHLWMLTSMAIEIFDTQKKIAIAHNTDIRQALQHPHMKYKYVSNLDKLDTIFSLSHLQNETISKVYNINLDKIITIGGGFNQNIFYPVKNKVKNDKIQLVFSAKIEQSKGVYELVKAFNEICTFKDNVHLTIIGTPNKENEIILDKLIVGNENISLLKITDQKILADEFRTKDIFIMPSYFEGLGLTAIEALATELRVVASEIEGLMSLLGDDINNSGVIEYVRLPRIYDTDKPYPEDLAGYVSRLMAKLLIQIERVEKEIPISNEIMIEIHNYSWKGIVSKINDIIDK